VHDLFVAFFALFGFVKIELIGNGNRAAFEGIAQKLIRIDPMRGLNDKLYNFFDIGDFIGTKICLIENDGFFTFVWYGLECSSGFDLGMI